MSNNQSQSKSAIAAEFAQRAKQFHSGENPMEIKLWGLFYWGDVSPYIKTGEIIPNKGYTKENRTIWCKPSQAFFDKWIAPLLERTREVSNDKSQILSGSK